MGGGGRKREGIYVPLWLICIVVWQKPTQHCKAIFLQLKKKKCSRKTEKITLSAQNVKTCCCKVKILRLFRLLVYYCSCFIAVVYSLSPVQPFATPWTVAHRASLSMRFSRQEFWHRLPFPPPGDLPDPGIEPVSPALTGRLFITEPPGMPGIYCINPKPSFSFTERFPTILPGELDFTSCHQDCRYNLSIIFQAQYNLSIVPSVLYYLKINSVISSDHNQLTTD